MALSPFFPNEAAFRAWRQGMPGIVPCNEAPKDPRLVDPEDCCYPTTEGPYFVSPEYLLLLVGPGASARYNVLMRVNSEAEADYRWYVSAPHPNQDGETVFAAYLWDPRQKPENIVGGETLQEARAALAAFLDNSIPNKGKSHTAKRMPRILRR